VDDSALDRMKMLDKQAFWKGKQVASAAPR
jgi:hypothetical protein